MIENHRNNSNSLLQSNTNINNQNINNNVLPQGPIVVNNNR